MKKIISIFVLVLMSLSVMVMSAPLQPSCIMDVKACWDGSSVSRDPANGCAFKDCPPEPLQQAQQVVTKEEPVMTLQSIETNVKVLSAQPTVETQQISVSEKIKNIFSQSSTVNLGVKSSSSSMPVQSQNIISADVGIDNVTIQVVGTAQKDVPMIKSVLMNLSDADKSTLEMYYKIHAKKKVNSDVVFMKVYKQNQGKWFKYSTTRYYFVENNTLKEASSWQFMRAKR